MDERSDIANLKARVKNLEVWQEKQNGHIEKTRQEIATLKYWIMGLLGTVVVDLLVTALTN